MPQASHFNLKKSSLKRLFFLLVVQQFSLHADSMSNVVIIPSANYLLAAPYATTPVTPTPFSCYNSSENTFFVSWHNSVPYEGQLYISYAIYTANGKIAVPTNLIFVNQTTPTSDIICCYNSIQNRYFLSWGDTTDSVNTIKYAVLDSQGSPVGSLYSIGSTSTAFDVFCSFNSQDNQYLLTWVDTSYNGFFSIINEDGSVSVAKTSITTHTGAVNSTACNIFSSYNPNLNEYLLAWIERDSNVYFSIYSNEGALLHGPTQLTSNAIAAGYSVSISYNETTGQYILTWISNNSGTYNAVLALCNQSGAIDKSATNLISVNSSATNSYNTYCSKNNQFLVSILTTNPDTSAITPGAFLCNASGTIVTSSPPIVPSTLSGWNPWGSVFSSYSSASNTFLLSWMISYNSSTTGMSVYSIYTP